ncbi:unnamed protein product [Bursaphelenchus xylophilus]|uniref:(pine wood nematode) hypothetical protein n=1 Tax=Bursaphelenchus xylophilus TaxID=6326 RepID=A0A1I7RPC4_BURXY|nr:unnamed protein product [Bursaphelenchus xylophilus]CAG9095783.1 unnamed protein product [Bursaphelenchus xylophilus]
MSLVQHPQKIGVIAGLGAAGVATAYFVNKYVKSRRYWNAEYVDVGRVDRAFIYPIKSCKPVETSYLDCAERGPRNGWLTDREYLVVDEANEHMFLTARTYPKMVLIDCEAEANKFVVKFPDGKRVEIDVAEVVKRNDVRRAALHGGKKTDGLDCGDEIGEALTQYLQVEGKRRLRLLKFDPKLWTERDFHTDPSWWHNPVPNVQDHINYSDMNAFMAISTGSLEVMNQKLAEIGSEEVEIRNFRPNFFINSNVPFAEDYWLNVRIGDAEFVCVRPCTRCILTTVNPTTGEKHPKMQPLKLLREFRLAPEGQLRKAFDMSPIFGVFMVLVRPGRVRVGDTVYAQIKPTAF